jgi:TPP-dependent pyruvate/acetoin dehydrogenase alpha subunit
MTEAIEHGDGPTFLEMKTYRYRGHLQCLMHNCTAPKEEGRAKKDRSDYTVLDVIMEKYATGRRD